MHGGGPPQSALHGFTKADAFPVMTYEEILSSFAGSSHETGGPFLLWLAWGWFLLGLRASCRGLGPSSLKKEPETYHSSASSAASFG